MAGARNIKGITIEIDGNTTKLVDSLKAVNNSIRDTQAALKDVNNLLKLDPGNTDLLRQKQEYLNQAISDTETKLQQEKAALEQLKNSEGFDKNSEQARTLERQIAADEQALKRLKQEAQDFGSVAKQQFIAAGQSIQEFGGKVESAGRAFVPVSTAAGATLTGLVGLGVKAATTADDLNTLAKQTGISTADLQKMTIASDRMDVSLEDITGSLRKMKNNMDSTSSTTIAAWDKLGVSTRNVDGSFRDSTTVFYEVVAALGQIENGTERDLLAMDLFGRSADSLAGLLDDGGEAFRQYGQEAEDMGLILSQDTLDRANQMNDTLDTIKATAGASLLELGATVLEAIQPVVDKIVPMIDTITQGIRNLSPEQMQLIMTITAVIAAIAPVLIIGGKLISGIGLVVQGIGSVVGILPALLSPIGLVVAAVAGLIAIFTHLYQSNETFRTKVNEVWEAIQEKISGIISAIQNLITVFIEVVKAIWAQWGDEILAVASFIWDAIALYIDTVLGAIQTTIQVITQLIQGDWEGAWNTIKTFVTDTMENIWSVVGDKVTAVKDTIVEKVGEAVTFLSELPGKALQWGKDLIDNFISGIRDTWDGLKNTVSDVAEGIADFIGFSEPKKGPLSNFHTYAPDMMKLYAQGIRDNMHLVTDQMNALAGQLGASAQNMASFAITNNVVLDGQVISSYVNRQLGEAL